MDRLVRSERGSEEEEEAVKRAGREVHEFVRNRWDETKWETAWFVNPPVSYITLDMIPIIDPLFAEVAKCPRPSPHPRLC